MTVVGRHFLTGELLEVRWSNPPRNAQPLSACRLTDCRVVTAAGANAQHEEGDTYLAPGLVDLQVNGYGGVDFTSRELSLAGVEQVARQLAAHGTTQFLATITTAPSDVVDHALRVLASARADGPPWLRQMLIGVHLEGPYISPADGPRGAHPLEHCQLPDRDQLARWQTLAAGAIRLVTLAPELPGSLPVIEYLKGAGVVVALGHLQANTEQIVAAVDAGARMSTHLGNGSHGVLPRHPNYLWDQLSDDRLWASLIVDGHHLPAAVVRTMIRAKGLERCLLVSDLTGLAGLPPGTYDRTGLGSVEILPDGRLVVAGQRQYLAGATRHLIENVELLSQLGEFRWPVTWQLAASQPRRMLGLPWRHLAVGEPVDMVELRQVSSSDSTADAGAFPRSLPWPQPCVWQVERTWVGGALVS